jgi:extradiol dioxygenase family protein
MPRLHVVNLVLPKLLDIGTLDEGRGKYGYTTCNVQGQRPHLGAVLTMDGEVFTLTATVTHMMLVLYHIRECAIFVGNMKEIACLH